MRVDFYQLGAVPLEQVIASLAEKLLKENERLVVVSGDNVQLARLDRILWDQGPASFLPHGTVGESDDSRQPVLLAADADAPNRARNLLIADGKWREASLAFERVFYLLGHDAIDEARDAWRSLAGRSQVERHYWANEDGRWREKSAARQSA